MFKKSKKEETQETKIEELKVADEKVEQNVRTVLVSFEEVILNHLCQIEAKISELSTDLKEIKRIAESETK